MSNNTGAFLHGLTVNEYLMGLIPYQIGRSYVIGIIGTSSQGPFNIPTLLTGYQESVEVFGQQDGLSTLPDGLKAIFDQQKGGLIVAIRVQEGASFAETKSNIIGTATEFGYTGIQAFLNSRQVTSLKTNRTNAEGVVPKIFCAPGFDQDLDVVNSFIPILKSLRSILVASGPNTTRAEAIAHRDSIASDRVVLCDNNPFAWDPISNAPKMFPISAFVAGEIARNDYERGWWTSPSNQPILGISNLSRLVPFNIEEVNSEANLLNERQIATIIHSTGFRLWGAWTCGDDPRKRFLHHTRVGDVIDETLVKSAMHHLDKNMTRASVTNIVEELKVFLRGLETLQEQAILGHHVWLDENKNSPDKIAQGIFHVDYKLTFPPIYVNIVYSRYVVDDYYGSLTVNLANIKAA